ncbi:hypothetical protein B566_EDAN011949 [Ephemera danica]|nr:hypothetical protein B566_EDAN011949 [Ephemera danica]
MGFSRSPSPRRRERDRERERRKRPRSRERGERRRRSAEPRDRERPDRERDSRVERGGDREQRHRRSWSRSRSHKDLEGKSAEEIEMMKMMGFCSFDSTKGKQVLDKDPGAVHVILKRKYRQYMNRKGGFNRPLDFVA